MMNEMLPKSEFDSANNILDTILSQRVEDIELSDTIPTIDDITDSNKVFKGKLSILFVDMSKSTDLTDELKSKKMVKVYRSFIRMVVRAIRYSDGQSRQFAGDGVMGVFQDYSDGDSPTTSCEKAVRAARYILTMIDYALNPALKKHLGDIAIGCGVGICTGTVMATKVGMRGKEADDTAENEMSIVWVGQTTNYASRFCGLAKPREIFIDETTYKGISVSKESWNKETRVRGTKSYTGYIASEYYLSLFDGAEIEPIISDDTIEAETSFVQTIFDETEERALQLVDEISKKSAELALKSTDLNNKEKAINNREINLNKRVLQIEAVELEKKYNAKYSLIEAAGQRFTKEQICCFGKDFWLELIKELETINSKLGRSDFEGYEYWRMSEIYEALEMHLKYYTSLCGMVRNDFSISWYQITPVLEHVHCRDTLIELLKEYVDNNGDSEKRDEYNEIIYRLED